MKINLTKSAGSPEAIKPILPVFFTENLPQRPKSDTAEISERAKLLAAKADLEKQLASLNRMHYNDPHDNEVRFYTDEIQTKIAEINVKLENLSE